MSFVIISQYILVTAGILFYAMIVWTLNGAIAFDSGIFDNSSLQVKALRDAGWAWGILIPVAAMAGNTYWLFRALSRKNAEIQDF